MRQFTGLGMERNRRVGASTHRWTSSCSAPARSPVDEGDIVVEPPPDLPKAAPVNPLTWLLPVAMLVAATGMMALYFTSGDEPQPDVHVLSRDDAGLAAGFAGVRLARHPPDGGGRGGSGAQAIPALPRRAGRCDHQNRCGPVPVVHWSHPDPLRCGPSSVADGCGNDDPTTPTSAGFVWDSAQSLSTRLMAPETKSSESVDPVSAGAGSASSSRSTVQDLPVVIDVRAYVDLASTAASTARGLARAMICQLAVLHSPAHVKIVAVIGDDAAEDWEWLKWLPHHRHPGPSMRCRSRPDDVPEHGRGRRRRHRPRGRAVSTAVRSSREAPGHGVTVVAIGAGRISRRDPDLCLDADGSSDRPGSADAGGGVDVRPPAGALSRGAPTVGERTRSRAGWAALNGLGDLARVDPSAWWRPRTGPRRLRVAIGVSEQGDPVELDIKEAAHGGMGPHGLCVGATGSGKSEFLRTLALGLVATHPPEALNLVLVDFKGGATFLGFEQTSARRRRHHQPLGRGTPGGPHEGRSRR